MERLRILIADDHPVYRDGLRTLIESWDQMELVGEARSGDEAIALAAVHTPDVILMDIQMPGTNGIDATREILAAHPNIAILILTMYEDDASVFSAMRAGARGYVLKGAAQTEILRAVEAVSHGEALFSPSIASRLMNYFSTLQSPHLPDAFPELTEREREILHLIAQGHTNPEIAAQLYLSEKTVRNHVSNIFAKLQVADRTQAVIRAREAGFGST
jgi:DNA-binding NarL/FixJ family response regulator